MKKNERHQLFGFMNQGSPLRSVLGSSGQRYLRLVRHWQLATLHLWDHFIPGERNGHKPHALRHRALAGYSAFLLLLKVLAIVAPIALPSSSLYSSAITPQNIVDLTNQTRANLQLGKLTLNELLAGAAQAKANNMLAGQYFAHVSPAGRTPWSWIQDAGYRYAYAGENLAVHFTSTEGVQEGWMASPSHRANIVHPKYTEIGLGIAHGTYEGFETTFVVEMFGTPAVKVAPAPPAAAVVAAPTPTALVPAPIVPQPVVSGEASEPAPVLKPAPFPVPPAVVERPTPASLKPIAVTPELVREPESAEATAAAGPVVYDASLKVVRVAQGYDVRIAVTGATSVVARFAGTTANLTAPASGSEWRGLVPFEPTELGRSGDLLSVTATGRDGATTERTLAWLAPEVPTQQFYTFNEGSDKFAKFFGFITVHNLNDTVRQFYLYFVVFLVAALLLNIFIKIRVQHVSVINHTMLVIALALLLSVV